MDQRRGFEKRPMLFGSNAAMLKCAGASRKAQLGAEIERLPVADRADRLRCDPDRRRTPRRRRRSPYRVGNGDDAVGAVQNPARVRER